MGGVRAGGGGRGGEGGRGGSQSLKRMGRGTDTCVYVLLQGGDKNCSALIFCGLGLDSAVAKLLSLGADAALKTTVRACSYMNTCMFSMYVCTFVDAWRMRISLYNAYHTDMLRLYVHVMYVHVIQRCVCVCMSPCVCRYTHTQRHSDTCACRIKCIVRG